MVHKKKIYAPRAEAERLAARFGVSKDIVNQFEYEDDNKMENNSKYSDTRIGKALTPPQDPKDEPVMDCVKKKDVEVGGIAKDRLLSLIERIERLEEEKKALTTDIAAVFAEAKSAGFNVKIMRKILKLRKMNAADRDEEEVLTDTYRKALDM